MAFLQYFYLLFSLLMACIAAYDISELKCEVCCRLVEEIQSNISSVDPSHVVQVSNYRLDVNGDRPKNIIPLARSQMYLTELMDSVCEKMNDYVRATYKNNGSLVIMPLILDGSMNPLMNIVDIIKDSDLNKSLQYYCEDIVNDVEDDVIKLMKSGDDDRAVYSICTKISQLCPDIETKVEL